MVILFPFFSYWQQHLCAELGLGIDPVYSVVVAMPRERGGNELLACKH